MFSNLISYTNDIETTLYGKKLILKNLLTMQYLPYGGIQMIINGQMVISTNIGYLATKEVEYDGIYYTIKEFSNRFSNLVNLILPN